MKKIFGSITGVRGRIYEANLWASKVYVLPTFHPAAALYNEQLKGDLERELKLLKMKLDLLEEHG